MITLKKVRQFIIFLLMLIGNQQLMSQEPASKPVDRPKWNYKVEPYMMFPNMSGNTGVSSLPLVTVDANASDIFSHLQFGAMLFVEATHGSWSVNSDFLFMNLKQDITPTTVINDGKVNAKQIGWELAGLRRLTPWLELGVGGLLNSLEFDMSVSRVEVGGGIVTQSGKRSKTWLDPMLIARLATNGKSHFQGQFRGEVGGFGIGSDLAWQLQVLAGYRFSKLFNLSLGYRAIGLDYKSGEGEEAFVYDMTTFGPMVRFGFCF
jgi:hypothetical protein